LYRFLEGEWERQGITRAAWSRAAGLEAATVSRWQDSDPRDIDTFRKLAAATGRPLLDIMVLGEYITEDEAGGHEIQPTPEPLSVLKALSLDQELSDDNKAILERLYETMKVAASVELRDTRRGRRGKPSTKH
jgi:transcriptional regulator with XRE-family HTH domain